MGHSDSFYAGHLMEKPPLRSGQKEPTRQKSSWHLSQKGPFLSSRRHRRSEPSPFLLRRNASRYGLWRWRHWKTASPVLQSQQANPQPNRCGEPTRRQFSSGCHAFFGDAINARNVSNEETFLKRIADQCIHIIWIINFVNKNLNLLFSLLPLNKASPF